MNELTIVKIPHRDQIKLTCFLGSGAFGEVFEGEARNLPGGQEKVAVKVRSPISILASYIYIFFFEFPDTEKGSHEQRKAGVPKRSSADE